MEGAGHSHPPKSCWDPFCCPQHCTVQGPRHPQGLTIPLGHAARGQHRGCGASDADAGPSGNLHLIWAMQGGSLQGGFQQAGKQWPDGTQIPARSQPPSQVCTAWTCICSREGFPLGWTSAVALGRHPSSLSRFLRHPPGQVPASGVQVQAEEVVLCSVPPTWVPWPCVPQPGVSVVPQVSSTAAKSA